MWTSEVHTRDPSAHRYPYWAGYGTYASVHLAKDLPSTLPSEKKSISPAHVFLTFDSGETFCSFNEVSTSESPGYVAVAQFPGKFSDSLVVWMRE